MSVVVKDCQNGKILLLSKGADEAILPLFRAGKTICIFFIYFSYFIVFQGNGIM